jgi:predicted Zn-dependent protease
MGFWLSRARLTIALVAGVVRPVRAQVFEVRHHFLQTAVFLPNIEHGSSSAANRGQMATLLVQTFNPQ